MSQKSRPVSPDILSGQWTPKPVFSQVNEQNPDDGSKVSSANDPQGDEFEVVLGALQWPQDGAQTLTVRLQKTGPADVFVTILLMQGTTRITGKTVLAAASFSSETLSLTAQERSLITDYRALHVRVIAGFVGTSACSKCPTAPTRWTFPLAGCSCTNFNRFYALSHQSGCIWREIDVFGQSSLIYDSGTDIWTLAVGNGPRAATYTKSGATWNCAGKNTMNLSSTQGDCTNWPASIEVSPGAL